MRYAIYLKVNKLMLCIFVTLERWNKNYTPTLGGLHKEALQPGGFFFHFLKSTRSSVLVCVNFQRTGL